MADVNLHEEDLAAAIHQAERAVVKANAAPAGPDRIATILKADRKLSDLNQQLDHLLSEQASPRLKLER
jgi:hypothetical protein